MDLSQIKKEIILGLPFACGSLEELKNLALNGRGLVVAPSAPCLALAYNDQVYARELAASRLAIADSGAMVLMWRLVHPKTSLQRVSGLAFLKAVLADPKLRQSNALFLVDPTLEASKRNRQWLRSIGIEISSEDQYVAPMYKPGAVEDIALLERLRSRAPRYVLINLGGGVQERLGAWLQDQWHQSGGRAKLPTLICTGAAIAFLSGEQSHIPRWADKLYLGWAIRCLGRPRLYVPRYFKSIPVLYYTLRDALRK